MDLVTLRAFFMWCTIINGGFLTFTALVLTFAGNLIYRVHSKWFKMPREAFNIVIYSFLGLYKIIFIVFCLVPYVVLVILG